MSIGFSLMIVCDFDVIGVIVHNSVLKKSSDRMIKDFRNYFKQIPTKILAIGIFIHGNKLPCYYAMSRWDMKSPVRTAYNIPEIHSRDTRTESPVVGFISCDSV
jgi:hypothetical protein